MSYIDKLTYIVELEMKKNGKYYRMRYGDGTINHNANISCSKQSSNGQYSCNITILNIDIKQAILFTRMPETIGKDISVKVVLGRGIHISQVFIGQVSSAYLVDFPTTSFTIECVGFNLYNGVIQVSCKKNINTNLDIKKRFADACGLQIKSSCKNDYVKIKQNYYYSGCLPMTEIKRFFKNEFVFVEGGILNFMDLQPNQINLSKTNSRKIIVLSESNGIIGIIQPNSLVQIQLSTLLLPEIQLGQKINLNCVSFENKEYNGTWFVCGLSHSGSFGYSDNNATSSFTLGKVSVV